MAQSLGCCHRPAGKAEVGPAEHTANLEQRQRHSSAQHASCQGRTWPSPEDQTSQLVAFL